MHHKRLGLKREEPSHPFHLELGGEGKESKNQVTKARSSFSTTFEELASIFCNFGMV